MKNYFHFFSSKLKKSDAKDNQEVLPDLSLLPPPPIWSRLLIWTLGTGTIFLIAWATLVRVEETVTFNGEITTSSSSVKISIPDEGQIISIHVKPYQAVKKGQVLMICTNKEINIRLKSLDKRLELLKMRKISDAKLNDIRRQQLTQQIILDQNILLRHESLLEVGAVQEMQVLALRSKLAKSEFQLSGLDEEELRQIHQTNQRIEEINNSKLELQVKSERFTVRSPVPGFIQQMKYQSNGERVQAGEEIFSIIPKLDLIVQVNIPSQLRAPVEINSDAKVSVDAFPSNEYGTIEAKVDSLSPMTQENSNTQRKLYKADLRLVKPSSPEKLKLDNLRPGMSVSAQMVLRDKPIITTIFNVFDTLFDPMTDNQ